MFQIAGGILLALFVLWCLGLVREAHYRLTVGKKIEAMMNPKPPAPPYVKPAPTRLAVGLTWGMIVLVVLVVLLKAL